MSSKQNRIYGTVVVVVIGVMPVVLWLLGADLDRITSSSAALVGSIGKAAALSGMALYALAPILSMRHKFIVPIFGGLDKTYKLHKKVGKTSFWLILAHPLALGAAGLLAGMSLATIWNWSSLLILTGLIGLTGLVIVTGFSIYAHIKHQRWIWVHRLFGWLLIVFYTHAVLAGSQIAKNPALKVYMLSIGALGLAAFFYRSVVGKYVIKRFRYEVAEVSKVTSSVTELVLKPIGIPITYNPGQFAYLSFQSAVVDSESHPFSFTTAPNGPYVRFAIKALGDDTALMQNLKEGTKTYLEGPYGNFSYRSTKNKSQVWVAGGVGITPFLSMARSLTERSPYKIHLFYAADKLTDAAFLQELFSIRKTIPDNFTVTTVNRDLTGFVTGDLIAKELGDVTKPDYFICGPPVMMKNLSAQLEKLNVPKSHIHTEEFSMM